jgi:hypothetical protein
MTVSSSKRSRPRDAVFGFLAAVGAAALVGVTSGADITLVLLPLAGVLVGGLVLDRTAGLAGLVIGYVVVALLWGTVTVANHIDSCRPDCVGLSSPSITIVLVIVGAVIVEVAGIVGFVLGRLARRIVRPNVSG